LYETYQDSRICTINIAENAIGTFKVIYQTDDVSYWLDVEIVSPRKYIIGPSEVYPYDIVKYTSTIEGEFTISDEKKAKIIESSRAECIIEILSTKKSSFSLGLITDEGEEYSQEIKIKSL
jgi:hypothetical protein